MQEDIPICSTCSGKGALKVKWPRGVGYTQRTCPKCKGFGILHYLIHDGIESIRRVQHGCGVYVTQAEIDESSEIQEKYLSKKVKRHHARTY